MSRRARRFAAQPKPAWATYTPRAPYSAESLEDLLRRDLNAWRAAKAAIKRAQSRL
jgi:hypothetical protein